MPIQPHDICDVLDSPIFMFAEMYSADCDFADCIAALWTPLGTELITILGALVMCPLAAYRQGRRYWWGYLVLALVSWPMALMCLLLPTSTDGARMPHG